MQRVFRVGRTVGVEGVVGTAVMEVMVERGDAEQTRTSVHTKMIWIF